MAVNANLKGKTVASPAAAYESIRPLWFRSRAVCGGEKYVKEYDSILDTHTFTNLLIPFSPSMTVQQYNFYKAEAELPGIVSQYAKIVVGGLLRKQPQLKLPDGIDEDAYRWIMDAITQDSSPLVNFLGRVLEEEIVAKAWIYVDYPQVDNPEEKDTKDFKDLKPYTILWNAESVINWRMGINKYGAQILDRIIVRNYTEKYGEPGSETEFHPELVDTVYVHEVVNGLYQIRKFVKNNESSQVGVVNGQKVQNYEGTLENFTQDPKILTPLMNDARMEFIPAWPANGVIEPSEPILTPLIDREVALYNKISRRNHLLYGAATYTPIISSDMSDDDFEEIVNSGLGSWIKLRQGDTATVLETPTAALQDMDRSIAATVEDMAKLGIRMLSPETDQSGVALEIRNAAQTAQLGTLNTKVSNQFADIIAFMLSWRYDIDIKSSDVEFTLSADFNPTPLGADWLRLVTEWYQGGLIPRSIWLQVIKQNDLIPADYNDEEGQVEITEDEMIVTPTDQSNFEQALTVEQLRMQSEQMANATPAEEKPKPKPVKGK